MPEISPEKRAVLSEAGRRGARTRLLGTTLEDRRELTAAASEARRRGPSKPTVEERIAAAEAALADMDPEERHRNLLWIAELRESTPRIRELRRRLANSHLDLAEAEAS